MRHVAEEEDGCRSTTGSQAEPGWGATVGVAWLWPERAVGLTEAARRLVGDTRLGRVVHIWQLLFMILFCYSIDFFKNFY